MFYTTVYKFTFHLTSQQHRLQMNNHKSFNTLAHWKSTLVLYSKERGKRGDTVLVWFSLIDQNHHPNTSIEYSSWNAIKRQDKHRTNVNSFKWQMRPGYQTNTRRCIGFVNEQVYWKITFPLVDLVEDISKRKHISLIVLFLTFNDAQINGHFHLKGKPLTYTFLLYIDVILYSLLCSIFTNFEHSLILLMVGTSHLHFIVCPSFHYFFFIIEL